MLPSRLPSCLLLVAVMAVGCGSSVPEARVATSSPAPVAADDLERYSLTPSDLHVEADVSAGKSYTLSFPEAKGTLAISPSHPEASAVDVDVDISKATGSWQTAVDIAKSRFLHTDRFPRAAFVSRGMEKTPRGLELFVDFTLHGVKKTLVVPATVDVTACRARIACSFAFSREAFGVVDDGSLEALVSDTAVIRVAVDVARKGAPAGCDPKQSTSVRAVP